MQLVKHIERGYGHAEEIISLDGRTGYTVRFFDSYGTKYLFFKVDFTEKVLEFVEDIEKTVIFWPLFFLTNSYYQDTLLI